MALADMYAWAIKTAQGKFHGNTEEHDGKLYWRGTVATEAEKNEIWNAIKTIPTWQKDIVADIKVTGPATPPRLRPRRLQPPRPTRCRPAIHSARSPRITWVALVRMKIFDLNKDQLSDPDKIKPGQVLKMP
jgi:hypothetical protein